MISHINLDIQKLKMFRLFPSDTCASDKDVNILHHHVNLDNSESIHAKQNIKRRKVILKIKYLKLGKRWFLSCHKHGTKQIFWAPVRNGISDLWIQCCNALPLSHLRLYGEQGLLPSSISTTYTTEPRPNTCFNLCQAFNKGLLKSLMNVQPDVHGKLRMREMNLPCLQTTDGINFCNIHNSTKTFESWAATLTNLVKQKDQSVTITVYHF